MAARKPRTITAAQLIAELQKLDPKTIIVMSCDEEGNRFSPMAAMDKGDTLYDPKTGSVYPATLTEEYKAWGLTQADMGNPKTMKKCVALWPRG